MNQRLHRGRRLPHGSAHVVHGGRGPSVVHMHPMRQLLLLLLVVMGVVMGVGVGVGVFRYTHQHTDTVRVATPHRHGIAADERRLPPATARLQR